MVALSAIKRVCEQHELGDLGQELPVGVWLPNGKRLTEFTLYPYNGQHDLDLGALEDNNRNHKRRTNRIYSEFMTKTVKSIGGYELAELTRMFDVNPFHFMEQLYLPDMLCLILHTRLMGYGKDIGINGYCACELQRLLKAGDGQQGYHDLTSVIIYKLPDTFKEPPQFELQLIDGWLDDDGNRHKTVVLEPPRFEDILDLQDKSRPRWQRLLYVCSVTPKFCDRIFGTLTLDDIAKLRRSVQWLEQFGPDRKIEMDCAYERCPVANPEWDSELVLGENYEDFYCSLLCAPRTKDEPGGTEDYFNQLGFFWSIGPDAPTKSVKEVRDFSPLSREQITERLVEFHKEQERRNKEAQSKAKSQSSRSRSSTRV
jgi:hypothetical protein